MYHSHAHLPPPVARPIIVSGAVRSLLQEAKTRGPLSLAHPAIGDFEHAVNKRGEEVSQAIVNFATTLRSGPLGVPSPLLNQQTLIYICANTIHDVDVPDDGRAEPNDLQEDPNQQPVSIVSRTELVERAGTLIPFSRQGGLMGPAAARRSLLTCERGLLGACAAEDLLDPSSAYVTDQADSDNESEVSIYDNVLDNATSIGTGAEAYLATDSETEWESARSTSTASTIPSLRRIWDATPEPVEGNEESAHPFEDDSRSAAERRRNRIMRRERSGRVSKLSRHHTIGTPPRREGNVSVSNALALKAMYYRRGLTHPYARPISTQELGFDSDESTPRASPTPRPAVYPYVNVHPRRTASWHEAEGRFAIFSRPAKETTPPSTSLATSDCAEPAYDPTRPYLSQLTAYPFNIGPPALDQEQGIASPGPSSSSLPSLASGSSITEPSYGSLDTPGTHDREIDVPWEVLSRTRHQWEAILDYRAKTGRREGQSSCLLELGGRKEDEAHLPNLSLLLGDIATIDPRLIRGPPF